MKEESKDIMIQSTRICVKENHKKLTESLWNTNFFLLFQGQLVSMFGNIVYDTAIRILILENTGSVSLMSMIMAATVIPEIFVSPFAGTFSDRHNRKKIIVFTDAISGLTILFIGIAAILGFSKPATRKMSFRYFTLGKLLNSASKMVI